jgi:hypothetical protein
MHQSARNDLCLDERFNAKYRVRLASRHTETNLACQKPEYLLMAPFTLQISDNMISSMALFPRIFRSGGTRPPLRSLRDCNDEDLNRQNSVGSFFGAI